MKDVFNLVIDSGNTLTKIAVFKGFSLVKTWSTSNLETIRPEDISAEFTIRHAIVSDVAEKTDDLIAGFRSFFPVIKMASQIPVPLKITYSTPETLGTDRIAGAVYGSYTFPGRDVLVIQAGTCITYDIVLSNGEYPGGIITPGVEMRLKAMNTFTAKLPLVKKEETDYLIGRNTNESILSGVNNGCIAETDGIIDKYRELFPELIVIFGGGNTFFFDKRLKNRIFATANLVPCGLNIILEFNKINVEK